MSSQGALAVANGSRSQNIIRELLLAAGFLRNPAKYINELKGTQHTLYPVAGQFIVDLAGGHSFRHLGRCSSK